MITKFIDYRFKAEKKQTNQAPKRIIFYRDGVSEGQFKQVLEKELPLVKGMSGTLSVNTSRLLIQSSSAACKEMNINPKITVIIVGKRHHVRFFPSPNVADRSGNCPAGTVVDRDVVHPTEFDFYLQSHGGLLGTSRPAHYSVLHDENGFS
jgi:eukaryotic translation initiation factor 2C